MDMDALVKKYCNEMDSRICGCRFSWSHLEELFTPLFISRLRKDDMQLSLTIDRQEENTIEVATDLVILIYQELGQGYSFEIETCQRAKEIFSLLETPKMIKAVMDGTYYIGTVLQLFTA